MATHRRAPPPPPRSPGRCRLTAARLLPRGLLLLGVFVVLGAGLRAAPAWLPGEDVQQDGLVVTVNRCARQPYTGGLAQTRPRALFEVNLSLMNQGTAPFSFSLARHASLFGLRRYPPSDRRERDALDPEFALPPGT